ncbi:hypothetical protein P879_01471 [Paragonimus westermani]|uniref:peptidyl-tRNA hydrolase n=1 Tax=Paragonimus westermani TaxID=34504 RepID=A0A8T0DVW3_9TREM|nr:hypothetical protein P879_01471 [Paragonimus westermani]
MVFLQEIYWHCAQNHHRFTYPREDENGSGCANRFEYGEGENCCAGLICGHFNRLQCSHAALDCFQYAQEQNPSLLAAWEEQGQPKIVLKSDSLQELELLSEKADSLGLVNSIIHDAGHTQVAAGTATVLGIGPGLAADIDRVTGDLKLF